MIMGEEGGVGKRKRCHTCGMRMHAFCILSLSLITN